MLWTILGLATIVLVMLYRLRWLDLDKLKQAPSRAVGLILADLFLGLSLMLIGLFASQELIKHFLEIDPETGQLTDASSLQKTIPVLINQVLGQLPAVLYLLFRAHSTPGGLRLIGVVPRRAGLESLVGLLALLATLPLVMAIAMLTLRLTELIGHPAPKIAHELLRAMIESDSTLATVLMLVSAVLFAAILEEGIFRGLIQSVLVELLGEKHRLVVVYVAAIIFAIIHLGAAPWQVLPTLFTLGLILGWLYERTGSLWPPIIVHSGFNAFNASMAFLIEHPGAS